MEHRPRLDPAVALTRRAVRTALDGWEPGPVIVGLSGGADSLALSAAVAFEAAGLAVDPVAVVVDHGLQDGSGQVAATAADAARALGLRARVERVEVASDGGPEASARTARYDALVRVAGEEGAGAILVAHTRDDQAETVLLGLARGSGAASLAGMAPVSPVGPVALVRPFLEVTRAQTERACAAQGLTPWHDPHNDEPRFARVRVRSRVMPMLERELGPGVAAALARTAEQLREDASAFDAMVSETVEDVVEHAEAGIAVSVAALRANPPALRHRIIRRVVADEFGQSLTRAQTVQVARLAVDWDGQGPIDLPGCRAQRRAGRVEFTAHAPGSAP